MADVFERIYGQPHVREFLRASTSGRRTTHAYLFTGPAGSNKTQAAFALAAALICPEDGCGSCADCTRIMDRKHPDVRFYQPEGANSYLVEQMREIVTETELAPIQASRKIFILDRIELMGPSAANAFLKTLEEPPADVTFILLGRTRESVLSTIVSRCIVVPFRHIPATEAAAIISQNTGASPELAKIAIEASTGSIANAMAFLQSNEHLAFRQEVLSALLSLEKSDLWDVIGQARELTLAAKAPLDKMRALREAERAKNEDLLSKTTLKQLEKRDERELKAGSLRAFGRMLAITASFLRDVLAVCAGTPELVINYDVADGIREVAERVSEAQVIQALSAVEDCRDALARNVSPETCVDALLLQIGEALYGSHSPC